jgi:hypothetical protein
VFLLLDIMLLRLGVMLLLLDIAVLLLDVALLLLDVALLTDLSADSGRSDKTSEAISEGGSDNWKGVLK